MKKRVFLMVVVLFCRAISYASDITPEQIREYRLQYGPRTAQSLASSYIQELARAPYYEPVRDKYLGLRNKPLQVLENRLINEQQELDRLRKMPVRRQGMYRAGGHRRGYGRYNYGGYYGEDKTFLGAIGDKYHYTKALEAAIAAKKRYFDDAFFHAQHPDSLQHLYGQ